MKDSTYKACGGKGCNRRHHRRLHREAIRLPDDSGVEDPQQTAEATFVFCSLKRCGFWPVILVIFHKTSAEKVKSHGKEIDLSVAGIRETNDVKCERFTVEIRGKTKSDTHHMTICTHPSIDADTKINNYRELKHAYSLMSVLSEKPLKFKDLILILADIRTKMLPYTSA